MATVTFDHVTKRYGEVLAVDDLSLAIADGEFMVLVGPSGCGKTTSLRMIAGLEEITEGTIRIGDGVVNDVAPKDRDIAMVFQSYALYPHMSVRDNMAFGLKLRKVPKAEIERRVAEAAGILGLETAPRPQAEGALRRPAPARRPGPGDRPGAGRLPHGRAAVEPRRQAARQTRAEISGCTSASDDDRLRHPRPGRGDDDGTPDRGHERGPAPAGRHAAGLYDHPANRFVAGFIGSPSMNFVEVTVDGTGDGATLKGPATSRCRSRPASARDCRQARRWLPASGRSTSSWASRAPISARFPAAPTSWSTSATRSSST